MGNPREQVVCIYSNQLLRLCQSWRDKADTIDEVEIIVQANMLVAMINSTQIGDHANVLRRQIENCLNSYLLPEQLFDALSDCKERLREDYKLK